MVQHGKIGRDAARAILRGNVTVDVEIYGRNGRGTYVNVSVMPN